MYYNHIYNNNNNNNNKSNNTNVTFIGLLSLIFITLKLTNVINWSWIWVLSPLWISGGIIIAVAFWITIYAFSLRK